MEYYLYFTGNDVWLLKKALTLFLYLKLHSIDCRDVEGGLLILTHHITLQNQLNCGFWTWPPWSPTRNNHLRSYTHSHHSFECFHLCMIMYGWFSTLYKHPLFEFTLYAFHFWTFVGSLFLTLTLPSIYRYSSTCLNLHCLSFFWIVLQYHFFIPFLCF